MNTGAIVSAHNSKMINPTINIDLSILDMQHSFAVPKEINNNDVTCNQRNLICNYYSMD